MGDLGKIMGDLGKIMGDLGKNMGDLGKIMGMQDLVKAAAVNLGIGGNARCTPERSQLRV